MSYSNNIALLIGTNSSTHLVEITSLWVCTTGCKTILIREILVILWVDRGIVHSAAISELNSRVKLDYSPALWTVHILFIPSELTRFIGNKRSKISDYPLHHPVVHYLEEIEI